MKKERKTSKIVLAAVSLTLIAVMAVGGTLAWLVAKTDPVLNTFTYGDIDLDLEETKVDEKGNPVDEDNDGKADTTKDGNEYEMLPGEEYLKDPAVTVEAGNEACWLFVKLEEKGGAKAGENNYTFDDYLGYTVADGWTQLEAEQNGVSVYYRYVGEDTDATEATYGILKDNKIEVKTTVNKDMLNALDNNGSAAPEDVTYPQLSITSYAIQYSGFEPEISAGATEPTPEQVKAAVVKAWTEVVAEAEKNS